MSGALGNYPMSRDSSGTAWQPDTSVMEGIHVGLGDWMVMVHGQLTGVYTDQSGPRGEVDLYQNSMLMAHATRTMGEGSLTLRGMVSLEPTEGARGYPLLFQTGESADGVTPLVDRQHPHNLLMESAAAYSYALDARRSVFVYAGLAGEPALGPTAFMHRFTAEANADAPLSHHWLDSTHLSYGTMTLGSVWGPIKVEGSWFNGREPDQYRYQVELRRFDSYSARLTYSPAPEWSMQVSAGHLPSPEQLEPNVSITRTTASITYHYDGEGYECETFVAFGQNADTGRMTTRAVLLESTVDWRAGIFVYGRIERVNKDELFAADSPYAGQVFPVAKLTLGSGLDVYRSGHLSISMGAQGSVHRVGAVLSQVYGDRPWGASLWVRARLVR